MKANLRTLVFIFSLLLNLGFVGTFVARQVPMPGGPRPDSGAGKPLFLELDLSPKQLAKLTTERDAFHADLRDLNDAVREKQVELIDLLAENERNQPAIKAKETEIQSLQAVIHERVIAHLLQVSEQLLPEQQARFFALLKTRLEQGGQHCPPGERPLGHETTGGLAR